MEPGLRERLPAAARAIYDRRTAWGLWAVLLGAASVPVLLVAVGMIVRAPTRPGERLDSRIATLIGLGLASACLACWAKAKGRSALWGLLGPGCLLGLVVLIFLPRRCEVCGRLDSSRGPLCLSCGGPL